jgi:hypothetical protein
MAAMNLRAAALLIAITMAALPASVPTFAQAPSLDGWIADAKTGCRIRNPAPQPRESVTWSGACPNGIAEGTGVLQWFDDDRPTDRYEGEMRDGWENGRGIATSTVIADRYDGEWRDGWRHGQGVYEFSNGDRYEGDWFEGLRTGRGTMVWADGARYEGEWLDSKPNGQGVYTDAADAQFSGTWSGGCFRDGGRKLAISTTARECGFE